MKINPISPVKIGFTGESLTQNENSNNTNVSNTKIASEEKRPGMYFILNKVAYPYPVKKRNTEETEEIDPLREAINAAFRDDECFDRRRDVVDYGYSIYDDNDCRSEKPLHLMPAENYLQIVGTNYNINKEFDTHLVGPVAISEDEISEMLEEEKKNSNLCEYAETHANGYAEKMELLNALSENMKRSDFKQNVVFSIANSARLRDEFGDEHIDYDMLNKGFQICYDRANFGRDTIKSLMRASVLVDDKKNERYCEPLLDFFVSVSDSAYTKKALEYRDEVVAKNASGYEVFIPEVADEIMKLEQERRKRIHF